MKGCSSYETRSASPTYTTFELNSSDSCGFGPSNRPLPLFHGGFSWASILCYHSFNAEVYSSSLDNTSFNSKAQTLFLFLTTSLTYHQNDLIQ